MKPSLLLTILVAASVLPLAATAEEPVAHSDCRAVETLATAPAALLRSYVPSDFEVPEGALVIVGAYECGPGSASVGRGVFAIQVTPNDAALESPGATNYFWEPDHFLVQESAIAGAFERAGAIATPASVDVAVAETGAAFDITAGGASLRFVGHGVGANGLSGTFVTILPPFREYSRAVGGYAYIDGGFRGDDGIVSVVAGTLDLSGDSAAAAVFGHTSVQVAGALTELDYSDAVVGFVARP